MDDEVFAPFRAPVEAPSRDVNPELVRSIRILAAVGFGLLVVICAVAAIVAR